jgi:adenine phosphoribosyltransferase
MKKTNYFDYVESFRDFPKKGVIFWDFTKLLKNPQILRTVILEIKEHFKNKKITKVAAIESKGFTLGSILAYELKKPLILIRKPGLIPGKTIREEFVKEYGKASYEIKENSFNKNDCVLIVYDIMAGSGASKAAINLIEREKAKVLGFVYVIELEYLKGRKDLKKYDLFSLVKIKKKYLKK